MTWIKLDDRSPWHPKLDTLSDRAFRWWIKGLCFASMYLTDGILPYSFLKTVPKAIRGELRKRHLWVTSADGNVSIHDYLKHQASRAYVESERQRNRERKRRGTAGTPAGIPEPENREQRTEKNSTPLTPRTRGARVPKVVRMQIPSEAEIDRQQRAIEQQIAAAKARAGVA